jgi:hypothetical protein
VTAGVEKIELRGLTVGSQESGRCVNMDDYCELNVNSTEGCELEVGEESPDEKSEARRAPRMS